MVKIKTKKRMDKKEFAHFLIDNTEKIKIYSNYMNGEVIEQSIDLKISNYKTKIISKDIVEVEVEEEITEDMVLPSIVVVRTQYFPNNGKTVNVAKINDVSINKIINTQPNNSKYEVHEIYLMNEVGIGELLWKDGAMVE